MNASCLKGDASWVPIAFEQILVKVYYKIALVARSSGLVMCMISHLAMTEMVRYTERMSVEHRWTHMFLFSTKLHSGGLSATVTYFIFIL